MTAALSRALGRVFAAVTVGLWAATGAPAQAPVEVHVSPDVLTLEVGEVERLFVSAFDAAGNIVPHPGVSFFISDTSIVRVHSDGTVSAKRPGSARVLARAGRGQSVVSVVVLERHPRSPSPAELPLGAYLDEVPAGARLTLGRDSLWLLVGEQWDLRPLAALANGDTTGPIAVEWRVGEPTLLEVAPAGTLTARRAGRTALEAVSTRGAVARVTVIIEDVPFGLDRDRLALPRHEMDTVRALVPAQSNRRLHSGLRWRMADTAVARVGPTGIVQGLAFGATELMVTGFGIERRLPVIVHRAVRRLLLSPSPGPDPLRLPVSGHQPIHVTALSVDSIPVNDVHFDWEIADPAVAAFDPERRVLAGLEPGLTSLTLRVKGFDPLAWAISVEPAPLAMERSRVAITIAERDTLRALILDFSGSPGGPASALRWESSAPEVVAVNQGGVVEGRTGGVADITARTTWGESTSAKVFVVGDLIGTFTADSVETGIGHLHLTSPPSVTNIPTAGSAREPRLAPDRTRVVFVSNRAGSDDLYLTDPDGRGPVRLTAMPGDAAQPSWTPDGQEIVFSYRRGEISEIRSVSLVGSRDRVLAVARSGEWFRWPAVSPDGRVVAFLWSRGARTDLVLLDLNTGTRRVLERDVSATTGPVFLPNGALVFTIRQAGPAPEPAVHRILSRDLESGRSRVLTESAVAISSLAASADGGTLFYRAGHTLFRFALASSPSVYPIELPEPTTVLDISH